MFVPAAPSTLAGWFIVVFDISGRFPAISSAWNRGLASFPYEDTVIRGLCSLPAQTEHSP